MLKAKQGFLLRRLGAEYMIVAIGAASENFNGMIRTNDTGAFLWKELTHGTTREELVAKMVERYEGLDADTAEVDLNEFLTAIAVAVESCDD